MAPHSQRRRCSGKKTLKGCTSKRNLDNVVLIDVDDPNDGFGNVIVIDVPESLDQELQGRPKISKEGQRFPFQGIISIDDDETDNEGNTGTREESGCDLESDASSSKDHFPSDFLQTSKGLDQDGCSILRERMGTFKQSRCKKTYSGKTPCVKCYGLSPVSDSTSLESGLSDCELMEGSAGKLREQWEKAFRRKKSSVSNSQSGLEDQISDCGSPNNINPNNINSSMKEEKKTEQPTDAPACSSSSDANVQKQNSSAFQAGGDGLSSTFSLNKEMESPFRESDKEVDNETFSWLKYGPTNRGKFSHQNADILVEREILTNECKSYEHVNSGSSSFSSGKQGLQGPPFLSNLEKVDTRIPVQNGNQNTRRGCSPPPPKVSIRTDFSSASFQEGSPLQHGKHMNNQRDVLRDQEFSQAPASPNNYQSDLHRKTSLNEKGTLEPKESLMPTPQFSVEKKVKDAITVSMNKVGAVSEESPSVMTPWSVPEVGIKKISQRGNTFSVNSDAQSDENQLQQSSTEAEDLLLDSMSNSHKFDNRHCFLFQGYNTIPDQKEIIIDREKLKETDDYKRAVEEEWASRQRELKLQAEEAQRLRKKKRAESMRLLDMERRQKQRVEEMRETQKKDEENMNTKEQLRNEVRKELIKLELSCIDMASLLRSLGVHVDGGFQPLAREVHAAYRRALLRFHPDRTSRTDIRQQVEAEEKFKLIARMKEKFLSTSCH